MFTLCCSLTCTHSPHFSSFHAHHPQTTLISHVRIDNIESHSHSTGHIQIYDTHTHAFSRPFGISAKTFETKSSSCWERTDNSVARTTPQCSFVRSFARSFGVCLCGMRRPLLQSAHPMFMVSC